MFCPVCKVEYRLGFTECSDCQVPLVEKLPDDRDNSGLPAGVDPETSIALWEGADVSAFAALRMALNDAGIYHKEWEAKSPLWRTDTRPPLAIWVQKPDEEAAQKILAEVSEGSGLSSTADAADSSNSGAENEAEETTGRELALPEDDSATGPAPDDIPEDFDPQDATREVWSGDDKQMANYLKMSLNENGIGCVAVEDFGKQKVRVLPAAEPRAKEIVRQVVDGTPPQ